MEFAVPIVEISNVVPIPNADAIEAVQVGDYLSVVQKGKFSKGDKVAYIPEDSVLPDSLIEEMGLVGRLAGSKKNRVKAIKLRGTLSQGLVYPARVGLTGGDSTPQLGENVADALGVTKYEPEIPSHMSGRMKNIGLGNVVKYDIENIKGHPGLLQDGEEVTFTEKIHGTQFAAGLLADGTTFCSSKGLVGKGLVFEDCPENDNVTYVKVFKNHLMEGALLHAVQSTQKTFEGLPPVYLFGEIFGAGIQDLHYGGEKLQFRLFDIYVGAPQQGRWLSSAELDAICSLFCLNRVPVLYRGPFSKEKVAEYTNGKETVSGKSTHIREGIVITPTKERRDPAIGRVILKSVSEDYLLRKNATEYN
jgi:RNA ligase (TIGR02306 family)